MTIIFAFDLAGFFSAERTKDAIQIGAILLVGFPLVIYLSSSLRRRLTRTHSAQIGLVMGKAVRYGGVITLTLMLLSVFGFSLAPLLGAAGIMGLALAFASQTSVSNIISGLFLIAEKPFQIGDSITVGGTTGVVLSIDTLSVKLRTFDNRFVRIPNETIIKSEVINITRFPVRRLDVLIGVSYEEDIRKARQTLLEVAKENTLCLIEPEPQVIFSGFGDSAINLQYSVWATRENYGRLKNSIQEEIKERFEKENISIPFPQVVVTMAKSQALKD